MCASHHALGAAAFVFLRFSVVHFLKFIHFISIPCVYGARMIRSFYVRIWNTIFVTIDHVYVCMCVSVIAVVSKIV